MDQILTITETAREFGTDVRTIRGLMDLLGIEPKPTPRNGAGKGLNEADRRRIRRAIEAGRAVAVPA